MPTRFPGGITNVSPNTDLANLPIPSPFYVGDVLYKSNLWADAVATSPATLTVTTVGTGTRVYGNTANSYGTMTMTNSAADNDSISIQSRARVARAAVINKKIHFTARYQTNTVNSDILLGITNSTTTPIGTAGSEFDGVTDGMFFLRPTTATTWSFYVRSGSATVAVATGLGSASSNVLRTLAFDYDPASRYVNVWIDNKQVAALFVSIYPATDLHLQCALQNGDANARIMNMEYIYAGQER